MNATTTEPPAGQRPSPTSPQIDEPGIPIPGPAPEPLPSGRRLYYGWVMLGVAALAMFLSGPGQSYSMAAFVDPMLADLDLRRSEYSLAYLVATLISGALLPFVGRLLDARGARRVLPVVGLLLGGACFGMSRVGHLLGLYFSLTAMRALGQGALTLTSTWMVGQWFHRRRGLAMGLLGLGSTLSFMAFPAGNYLVITAYGWRTAWVVLGVVVLVLLMVPALLLVRNRPEDIGLTPAEADGGGPTTSRDGDASEAADEDRGWTSGEACRHPTFWKIVAALATSGMVITGLVFHQVSILAERGISAETSLGMFSLQAAFACLMSLLGGTMADRIPPRRLLAASMVLLALAIALVVAGLEGPALILPYSVLLGLHTGIQRFSGAVALLGAFGRAHFGSIKGIAMSLVVGAAALGPLPLAMAKDALGRYDLALAVLLLLPIGSAVAVWTAYPPSSSRGGTVVEPS